MSSVVLSRSDSSHSSLIAEIADDYAERLARGESPDIEQFVQRLPEQAEVVRDILRSMKWMYAIREDRSGELPNEIGQENCLQGTVGEFEILEEVGRGGMGVVYRARQSNLDRIVALKVLPLAASLDPIKLKRFRVETQSASMIQHPNVVAIYGTGCDRGIHYYAMQFIDGLALDECIAAQREHRASLRAETRGSRSFAEAPTEPSQTSSDGGMKYRWSDSGVAGKVDQTMTLRTAPFSVRESVEMIYQCADALHQAHELGVIHRDIKPSNLMLDRSGKIWITDFGLAHVETQGTLTATGDFLGTLRYMSPEQAIGGHARVDRRSDVYSLGATLFELLALEPMLTGMDRATLLRQLTMEDPRTLRKLVPSIPRDLETIVLKAVSKQPEQRYASAADFANDLERFLTDQPILARRPSFLQMGIRLARRHRTAAWTIAAAPLVIVGGLAWSNVEVSRQRNRAEASLEIAQKNETKAIAEANKANAVSQVLQQLVAAANPDQSKGGNYTVRQLLDDVSGNLLETLEEQPEVEASLRSTVGNAYRRLGAPEKALPHLRRVLELRRSIEGDSHLLAEAFEDLAWNEAALGKYDKAEELARQCVAFYRESSPSSISIRAAWCLQHCLIYRQKYADADRIAQAAIIAAERMEPKPMTLPNILHDLSHSKNLQGQYEEAESLARKAVEMHAVLHGKDHPETGWGLDALARSLQSQKRNAEAADTFRKALHVFRANYPADHKSIKMTLELLRDALEDAGLTDEAEEIDQQRYSEAIRGILGSGGSTQGGLLKILVDRNQYAAAGELVLSAPDLFQECGQCLQAMTILDEYSNMLAHDLGQEGLAEFQKRVEPIATLLLERAITKCPEDALAQNTLSWMLISQPNSNLRRPMIAVDFAQKATRAKPDSGAFWNTLGLAWIRAEEYQKAIDALERSRQFPTTDEYDLVFLAMAHWHLGHHSQATELFEEARTTYEKKKVRNRELEQFMVEAMSLIETK